MGEGEEMKEQARKITRDLSERENWSGRALKAGEIVYLYRGHTYGCVTPAGQACTFAPAELPFFEVPLDALGPVG